MYSVEDLFKTHKEELGLELFGGREGLKRKILVPEVERPGLSLAGYLKGHAEKRILIFGKVEMQYLRDLSSTVRDSRLKAILTERTPAVIIARHYKPVNELYELCEERKIPLFRTGMETMHLISQLTLLLNEKFAPSSCCHGTLVEIYGVGVLIQGDSSVGKSEAALGLIERGHRLISDDVVKIRKREGFLEGFGAEMSRYHMEIRGIGIINVATLFGAVCVREKKSLDLVVKLEMWDSTHVYDRTGVEDKNVTILGISLPFHLLPVKVGQDVVLFLETLALNHRLKTMGFHSAKEFKAKLLSEIAKKEQLEQERKGKRSTKDRKNGQGIYAYEKSASKK